MKIALAQIDPTPGDVAGNAARVADAAGKAASKGADLVVFPEMAIAGWPCRGLLASTDLPERCEAAVRDLAARFADGPAILAGLPRRAGPGASGRCSSAVGLLDGGKVTFPATKKIVAAHDAADEDRWIEPGEGPGVADVRGAKVGIAVGGDPAAGLQERGARIVVKPCADPFFEGRPAEAEAGACATAAAARVPIVMVNQVGGNDDLVYSGGSLAVDASGATRARAPIFEEAIAIADVDPASGSVAGEAPAWTSSREEILCSAIVLGIRDYVGKAGAGRAILGLSGGIDSALVAALATVALGERSVRAIAMPSRYSSEGSLRDAADLARNLGIRLDTVSIEPAFTALLETLGPHFGAARPGLAEENLQARIRGTMLMAFSNKLGGLVLATGNESEISVGYCTMYGDTVGAIAPIGDLLKKEVYALARYLNGSGEIIPASIIEKAPSAELRPGQRDEDSLPPYDLLDRVIAFHSDGAPAGILDGVPGGTATEVLRMLARSEFKRSQLPIAIRLKRPGLARGRRYPLAHGFRE